MENKVIISGGEGEIIEKKSRFIATIRPVSSEDEAAAFIKEMKKKYYDARHNCSAYILAGEDGKPDILRSSDDGEPGGTAGRPMLDVLTGEGIRNVVAVVTRYFGGTLLGTGGLVRAYQGAMKEALLHCEIAEEKTGFPLTLSVPYDLLGKVEYLLRETPAISVRGQEYLSDVVFSLMVPTDARDGFEAKLVEATNAKAEMTWGEMTTYVG